MAYDTAVKAIETGIEIADILLKRDITFCHRRNGNRKYHYKQCGTEGSY